MRLPPGMPMLLFRIPVLNRYTALGIPVTEAVGQVRPGKGDFRLEPDLCHQAQLLHNLAANWLTIVCVKNQFAVVNNQLTTNQQRLYTGCWPIGIGESCVVFD